MRHPRFRLKPYAIIAASVALAFAEAPLYANPTGAQVLNGTVSFQRPNAGTLNVTNSPGSIVNWQGFSIGAGEVTRFIQQSAASAVLNRVVGGNLSQIYGQLLSNGRVFLVNPGGIVVGPGAIVDTAGFVGSTLNMMNADFLAGKLKFEGSASSGAIVNQGWIRTSHGGQVVLVAPQIENNGLIHTPGGELILAAGQKLTVSSLDHEGVQFELQAPTDQVVNVGRLLAEGGAVGVFAGTLKHSGDIRATSMSLDATGHIVLKGSGDVQLAAGSITEANGPRGGRIEIQSGGTTLVSGTVEARGLGSALAATVGEGGSIHVLGERVGLIDAARLDVSGKTGGGTVLVGGDYQGKNPAIQNTERTYVGPDASIKADAVASGDGGRVIVWGNDITRFYGGISARGGAQSGDGGFVEVSGRNHLDFRGTVNTLAPKGKAGTLLLDPTDIEINATDTTPQNTPESGGIFQEGISAPALSEILASNLETLLGTGNVTIRTQSDAGANGNVTFNASVFKPATGTRTLRVEAENDIVVSPGKTIGTNGGPLNVEFIADFAAPAGGGIKIDNGASIITNGGTILLAGNGGVGGNRAVGTGGTSGIGVYLINATLDAGAGDITIRGQGQSNVPSNVGVRLDPVTVVKTTDGSITISGLGGDFVSGAGGRGIVLAGNGSPESVQIKSTGNAAGKVIQIDGKGGIGPSGNGTGIGVFSGALIEATGAAIINLSGEGGNSGGSGSNVGISHDGSTIRSNTGAITLNGTGRGAGTFNNGVEILNFADIESVGSAPISITGSFTGAGSGVGIELFNSIGTIGNLFKTSTITLTADSINIVDSFVQTGGTVTLQPLSVNRDIFVETADTANVLSLTPLEIQNITALNKLAIGRSDGTGTLTVNTPLTAAGINNAKTLSLEHKNVIVAQGVDIGAAGTVIISAAGGSATQAAPIKAGSLALLGAGGNHVLTNAQNAVTTLAANTGSVNYVNNGALSLGTAGGTAGVTVTGNATLQATGGELNLAGTSSIGGILTLTGVGVTQVLPGTLTVGGTTVVNAGTGSVLLDSDTNNFTGPVTLSSTGVSAKIHDVDTLNLASLSLGANTAIEAIAGTTLTLPPVAINTGSGNIDLRSNGGALATAGALTTTSGTITLVGSSGLTLGHDITASNANVSLTGLGVTQTSGKLVVGGSTTVDAGAANIALNTSTNNFTGPVTLKADGPTVSIFDVDALTLAAPTLGVVDTRITAVAGTTLTLPAADLSTGKGDIIFFSNGGTLATAGALTTSGKVSLTGANGLTVSHDVTADLGGVGLFGAGVTVSSVVNAGSGAIVVDGKGGQINLAGGTLQTTGASGTVMIRNATTAVLGNVTAPSGTLALGENQDITGAVTQNAGTVITAGTLTASTKGAITLDQLNAIDNLGAVTRGGALTLNDTAGGLNLTGAITGGTTTNAVSITTVGGPLSVGADITASGATGNVSLTGVGVTQTGGTLIAGGATVIDAGAGPIALTGSANDFQGRVTLNNSGANDVTISSAGAVTLGASTLGSGTLFVDAGSIAQTGAITQSKAALAAIFTAGNGSILLANAQNKFSGAVSLDSAADAKITSLGTLTLDVANVANNLVATASGAGSVLNVVGDVTALNLTLNAGTVNIGQFGGLFGSGTINAGNVVNSGTVSPGASPGVLFVTGNYVQTQNGKLLIEIAGTAPEQFDRLIVTGSATLGGTLQTVFLPLFSPVAGDAFPVVQAGNVIGEFSSTSLPPGITAIYLASSVSVATPEAAAAAPGPAPGPGRGPGDGSPPIDSLVTQLVVDEESNLREAAAGGPSAPEGETPPPFGVCR